MYRNDPRIVLTLNAGGQSFRFSAMLGNKEIGAPCVLCADVKNLNHCLETLVQGFSAVMQTLPVPPVAISFAFPGPSDYPNGIIGDLPNLPAFRGGVPLKAFLEQKFQMPVFINNDGDLFAYGEALAGFLPYVNQKLSEAGSTRRYKNLVGVTLGTGFGCGIVRDSELFVGDNSAAAEVWCMRAGSIPDCIAEDTVNSAAVIRYYQAATKSNTPISARDIYEIAEGSKDGNREAALYTFKTFGSALGDALANILAIADGVVVIGGGVAGASKLFMPHTIAAINSTIGRAGSDARVPRIVLTAYDLENEADMNSFVKGTPAKVTIPNTNICADYDPVRRTAIGISRMGDTLAMATGAYCFALHQLDKR
jgi:glucokinase